MPKRMLVDASHPEETRVVVLDGQKVEEFDFEAASRRPLKGNIYLAKITRVEPSLQAAFVEYGGNKQGFLPFSEIHPDYYQIPVSDRQRLMEEAEQETPEEETSRQEASQGESEAPVVETTEADSQAEASTPSYLSEPVAEAPPLPEAIVEQPMVEESAQPDTIETPTIEETAEIITPTETASSEAPGEGEEKPAEEGMETIQ